MIFNDLDIRLDKEGPDARQWVTVMVKVLADDETFPYAEAALVLPPIEQVSVAEMRQIAADRAADIFEKAALLLRSRSVAQWRQHKVEEEQRAETEREAALAAVLSGTTAKSI